MTQQNEQKCPGQKRAWGPPEVRFWRYVDKTPGRGPWGDCWIWTGALKSRKSSKNAYGRFSIAASTAVYAHRWLYEHLLGPATGLHVCHKCDNSLCVNPAHLFLGTHSDNMRDAGRKGRLSDRRQNFHA